jgi:hypothetical protein
MTSLGFSEYSVETNENTRNGNTNGKIYNRRNGGGGNRTLKIPRNNETNGGSGMEKGLLQSVQREISNENGNNNGVIQQAGKKMKQIKDYIENIHRKGGEDSDADGDDDGDNVLPSYPAQGMGVYASNISHSSIIPGVSSTSSPAVSSSSSTGVRKTTQMNSLHPGSSYSSTLFEGMNTAPTTGQSSLYFEKLSGTPGAPKKELFSRSGYGGSYENEIGNQKTSTYASKYYEQFVPYAETLANQLASSGGASSISGTNAALIEKLNYIIHMLEEKKDEKTGHVIEELVLYCFLGVFIIFVVDTFTRASSGSGSRGGGMFGGGNGVGRRSYTASSYGRYQR